MKGTRRQPRQRGSARQKARFGASGECFSQWPGGFVDHAAECSPKDSNWDPRAMRGQDLAAAGCPASLDAKKASRVGIGENTPTSGDEVRGEPNAGKSAFLGGTSLRGAGNQGNANCPHPVTVGGTKRPKTSKAKSGRGGGQAGSSADVVLPDVEKQQHSGGALSPGDSWSRGRLSPRQEIHQK